jgi:hypothetical protein
MRLKRICKSPDRTRPATKAVKTNPLHVARSLCWKDVSHRNNQDTAERSVGGRMPDEPEVIGMTQASVDQQRARLPML